MEMSDILTTVNGQSVTAADVVAHLKCHGIFRNAVYQLIENKTIEEKCTELRIKISETEFRDFADTKRRLQGLFSAEAMNQYCKLHGIVMDQWNALVHQEVLRVRLKDKVITNTQIEDFFNANKNSYVMASVSRIVCPDQQTAEQAKISIVDDGLDFATVARDLSIEKNTRSAGGFLGRIKFGSLPDPVNNAVFSSQKDALIGPFDQNGYWTLYRVEEIGGTKMNEVLQNNIKDQLFNQWLKTQVLNAKA